jgi:quercetin dioxygenase-like cupin family protein
LATQLDRRGLFGRAMAASAATILMPLVGSVGAKAATGPLHINPAEETIRLGPLSVRFLVTGRHSTGSLAAFEIMVPGRQRLMAPAHSHDKYEETIYGIDGVLTWTVNGARFEIGPGQALCIARGAVHRFDNHGDTDVKALCVISPAAIGPAFYRESAEVICSNLPVRRTKSRWLRSCGATARRRHLLPSSPAIPTIDHDQRWRPVEAAATECAS